MSRQRSEPLVVDGAGLRALLAQRSQRPRKFHNVPVTDDDGVMYDSKAEREYASVLRQRQAAGLILAWWWGPRYLLQGPTPESPDAEVVTYRPDFLVCPRGGDWYAVDVKGVQTKEFRIKAKLWKARHPGHRLVLVEHGKERDA